MDDERLTDIGRRVTVGARYWAVDEAVVAGSVPVAARGVMGLLSSLGERDYRRSSKAAAHRDARTLPMMVMNVATDTAKS